jgi:hypothetical protein
VSATEKTASRLSWLGLVVLAGGFFWLGRKSTKWPTAAKEYVAGGVKKHLDAWGLGD